jgi:hypothetical protein
VHADDDRITRPGTGSAADAEAIAEAMAAQAECNALESERALTNTAGGYASFNDVEGVLNASIDHQADAAEVSDEERERIRARYLRRLRSRIRHEPNASIGTLTREPRHAWDPATSREAAAQVGRRPLAARRMSRARPRARRRSVRSSARARSPGRPDPDPEPPDLEGESLAAAVAVGVLLHHETRRHGSRLAA